MTLLPVAAADVPFLWEMLVEAAFPPGVERPVAPLAEEHLRRYLDGWGDRPDDIGLVAWEADRRVGATWMRTAPTREQAGDGWIDARTPELAIAVVDDARGRGIGRALLRGALDLGAERGFARVSLSVFEAVNPIAHRLYLSEGFVPAGRVGWALTMVAPTGAAPPSPGGT